MRPARQSLAPLLVAAGLLSSCGAPATSPVAGSDPSRAPTDGPAGPLAPTPSPAALPVLRDGVIGPTRSVVLPPLGGWGECVMDVDCPEEPPHARTLRLAITVPDGWKALEGFDGSVIVPEGDGSTDGPDGAGAILGWSNRAGLHSDPCLQVAHQRPDIAVGPSVGDFVEAIRAHPLLSTSEPVGVELDGHRGLRLTLTAPLDLSGCDNWRPWEPGIFAQGPGNIWTLWIIDVDGLRMVLLASEFPGTSAQDRAALQAMIESIRFLS